MKEATAHIPDGAMHYCTEGSGPPLLLLHSAWACGRFWFPVMGPLGRHFAVYAPDMIGHGDSARLRPGYSIPDYAKSVADFMDAVGIAKARVVGNSFSGTTSVELAASFPQRVEKLVLVAPPVLETEEEREGRKARFRATLDDRGTPRPMTLEELKVWFVQPTEELRALVNEARSKAGPGLLDLAHTVYSFDVLSRLSWVSCPTLVLYGEKDNLRGKEHKLAHGIRDSRLVILPGTGHIPQLEAPDGFVRVVLEFLEG